MSHILKNFIVSHQQIRFLPRFNQAFPAGNRLPHASNLREQLEPTIRENSENTSNNVRLTRDKPVEILSKSTIKTEQSKLVKPRSVSGNLMKEAEQSIETTTDQQGNLLYAKMSNNDPRIKKIMGKVKSQKKGQDVIMLEGKRLIKEALEAKCKLEYILFSRLPDVEQLKPYLPKAGKLYKMPYKELQIWSDLTTNPGVIGIFQVSSLKTFQPEEALPLTVICDNVREPNNLGAILRTSSGVGCKQVILTKGCVNVWDSKVLRSACGAHFKVNLLKDAEWTDVRAKLPKNASIFIADNNILSTKSQFQNLVDDLIAQVPILPYYSPQFNLSSHIVLIIGGETEGISQESYELAKEVNGVRLNVPLSNGVDSLNTGTALGVIAFEIKRQWTCHMAKMKK